MTNKSLKKYGLRNAKILERNSFNIRIVNKTTGEIIDEMRLVEIKHRKNYA